MERKGDPAILSNVVVPYADFLERRERRCRIVAELLRHDAQRTIDADVVATRLPTERKYRYEHPGPVTESEPPK